MKLSSVYLQNVQNNIDKISNNMANTITPGFKQQLLFLNESYDTQDKNNSLAQFGALPVTDYPVQNAELYLGKRYDFSQGVFVNTENPLDMAIDGEGFFKVKTDNGTFGYTRAGIFSLDRDRNVVNNVGMLLDPPVRIPDNVFDIRVDEDGGIRGSLHVDTKDATDYSEYFQNEDDREKGLATFGRVSLFTFENPDGLELSDYSLFLPSETSGQPVEGKPGDDGYGIIRGATLEKSNTEVTDNMTSLIQMQRIYELNLRITQDQNEMSRLAIQMRG